MLLASSGHRLKVVRPCDAISAGRIYMDFSGTPWQWRLSGEYQVLLSTVDVSGSHSEPGMEL